MKPAYQRPVLKTILRRLKEPRKFIQIIIGPRQVGKTTLIRQALEVFGEDAHYAAADAPAPRDPTWLEAQWDIARLRARSGGSCALVLDEIQKVVGWSELVKRLWDEDTASGINLKTVLLGSSPLLMQKGLSESLAGRFEVVRVGHWSFSEMKEAFGWNLEQYLYFGSYPGAAGLIAEEERWRRYVLDSLIETTLSKDILFQVRVDKPALLRRLFHLGCDYSGQILSFHKMLGQLHDAGNTVTLAHYLDLLSGAGMLTGLQKYSGSRVKQRGSSPKFLVLNTALMTSMADYSFSAARENPHFWGRLVESAVGAHLVNGLVGTGTNVFYWRQGNHEVDFVVKTKAGVTAIEVKTSRAVNSLPGMSEFAREFHPQRKLLVGASGMPLKDFFSAPCENWVSG